ncbi:NAD(P)/FAD-dependent oxidoreductase [Kutzneria viridogrisea]|uniref:2-polyprenyl-6-methoxyphenol hydroxylase-like FAD-dependent oxidoreductase n=1 Tax=Kutzneria viridogrisea TaxID=47990 RepID=A0ABR6BY43_9PSEU|nr:2-polyprenyl-6-methoxyphenol hydroxylase-like FAD-dependent oxidoreductase [Kutzneria viridogrisea]
MSTAPLQVLVIGGGTGGLCLAQGLKRAGVSVAVYERDQTRSDGLQGYRVGIDPDGKRALRACLSEQLYDTFIATCAKRPVYFNQYTEQLSELFSSGPEIFKEPPNFDELDLDESVSRMTLRQVLLTGLDDVVHFEKRFTHYEQRPDGKVTAFFEDSTSVTGDVLVAADGTNSKVRTQYLPQAKLVDTGLIGITGKTLLTDQTRKLLPRQVIDGVSMVQGKKGFMCILHVMRFPWDTHGELKDGIGRTETELIRQWPGLLYANSRDYIMWGFAAADHWLPEDTMQRKGAQAQRLVQELTADWHPNLRQLFALGDSNSCFPLKIRTSEPIPQWKTTNVTLIGDAIHTMTPGRGVGANTALRDAALLCKNLVAAQEGRTSLLDAVRDYETKMVKYGFEAVIKSRQSMDGHSANHKSGLQGMLVRGMMRTSMRAMNQMTFVKRKMAMAEAEFRGAGRTTED